MKKKDKLNYYKFLNSLPKKINKLYFGKLIGKFKLNNKSSKKNGFDPVTNIDKALELFLRKEITKRFPKDGIIGEEYKTKKTKNGFSWILDPIDGTRSFVIGSPTWSNLISINYNNEPTLGLVNFPMLKKYYITGANNNSYLVENNKFKKLKVIKAKSLNNSKALSILVTRSKPFFLLDLLFSLNLPINFPKYNLLIFLGSEFKNL